MESTRYLIVGGGMTGDAAVKGIREHDADGSIVLVGAEPHPPYARPPLTKGLWSGGDEAKIWRGTERRRRRAAARPPDRLARSRGPPRDRRRGRRSTRGRSFSRNRRSSAQPSPASDGVVYYRTLDDYRTVRARVPRARSAVVIGGGFIGSEIAASLTDERRAG